jgi:hypothetical protein
VTLNPNSELSSSTTQTSRLLWSADSQQPSSQAKAERDESETDASIGIDISAASIFILCPHGGWIRLYTAGRIPALELFSQIACMNPLSPRLH